MFFAYSLQQLIDTYNTAASKVAGNARWPNALDKAFALLKKFDEIEVTFDAQGTIAEAIIPSQSGKESYRVNGHCSCQAAQHGNDICAHRAAKQLVVRMYEQSEPAQIDGTPEQTRMTLQEYRACKASIEQKIAYQQARLAELEATWQTEKALVNAEIEELFV